MSASSTGLRVGLARVMFSSPLNGDCTVQVLGPPELWSHPHQICFGNSADHIPLMHVPSAYRDTTSSAEAWSGALSQLTCPTHRT